MGADEIVYGCAESQLGLTFLFLVPPVRIFQKDDTVEGCEDADSAEILLTLNNAEYSTLNTILIL